MPEESGPVMFPFQAVPAMVAPVILKTTVKLVMGAEKELSTMRTTPPNPPCHVLVARTLTVTPPPETATDAVPESPAAEEPEPLSQATRERPRTRVVRRGPSAETFPRNCWVASIKPPLGDTGSLHCTYVQRRRSMEKTARGPSVPIPGRGALDRFADPSPGRGPGRTAQRS